jgi:threonine aldolase
MQKAKISEGALRYSLASDNTAGLCPEAMQSLAAANGGSVASYGDDSWTDKAANQIREIFETDCEVFFVFNGTAANSLALASLCASYHSVIGHESSHIETDECGAPEFFSNGTKLLLAGGSEGKLSPQEVERLVLKRNDIHYPKPRVVSLSQPTELGTVYSLDEIGALMEVVRKFGLHTHMDGARFAHALATLGCSPADATWRAGLDVLCFGGTKLGIALGEAVVFFNKTLATEFAWRCKQAGQLASKMRFLSAPWSDALHSGLWMENAKRANSRASLLAELIRPLEGAKILYPVQANSVFLQLPDSVHASLRESGWIYYVFIGGGARLMCSWATSEKDIHDFVASLRVALAACR